MYTSIKLFLIMMFILVYPVFCMEHFPWVFSYGNRCSLQDMSTYNDDVHDEEEFICVQPSQPSTPTIKPIHVIPLDDYISNPLAKPFECATWISQNIRNESGLEPYHIDKMFACENIRVGEWFFNHTHSFITLLNKYDSSVKMQMSGDRANGISHCLSDLNVAVSTSNPKLLASVLRYYYKDNAIADHQEYVITPEKMALVIKGLRDDIFSQKAIIYTFLKHEQYDEALKKEKIDLNNAVESHEQHLKFSYYICDYKKIYYALGAMNMALQNIHNKGSQ